MCCYLLLYNFDNIDYNLSFEYELFFFRKEINDIIILKCWN